jgi:hypothetical protein
MPQTARPEETITDVNSVLGVPDVSEAFAISVFKVEGGESTYLGNVTNVADCVTTQEQNIICSSSSLTAGLLLVLVSTAIPGSESYGVMTTDVGAYNTHSPEDLGNISSKHLVWNNKN